MINQSVELARKIAKRIATDAPITYSTLEARAKEKGIAIPLFEQAMTIIQRSKTIESKVRGDDIVYTIKVVKKIEPGSHLTWVRHNYPVFNESNNGSGIEADFSYLFLTPEELLKYKAEIRGVAYIPRRRYAKKI